MPEIILRLRVLDRSGPDRSDVTWQKYMATEFLPGTSDDMQLWDSDTNPSPLAPIVRRWWTPDGRVLIEVAELVIDTPGNAPIAASARPNWVRWGPSEGDAARLLRQVGWEVLSDG
jgi:hypothetical protein